MSFALLNVFLQTNNDERVEVLFRYYNGVSGGRITEEYYGSSDGGRVSAILQGYSVANTDIKYNPVKKMTYISSYQLFLKEHMIKILHLLIG